MSRRTKLIIVALFLVLLGIPVWHVGRNWNPPSPLRFRLVSQQSMQDESGFQWEELEIEVLNTSTAPRRIEFISLRHDGFPSDPFANSILKYGTVIPAGGTRHGFIGQGLWTGKSHEPPMLVDYTQASTSRHRILTWYGSLIKLLPWPPQQQRFAVPIFSESNAPLEVPP
jgi:hypothetical protein